MADKLAVIQATETLDELDRIENKTKDLIVVFKSLVEQGNKINSGLTKGTPKEFSDSFSQLTDINKKYKAVIDDVARANNELERIKKRIAFANTSEGKDVALLKVQLQDLNKVNRDSAKSMLPLLSAYDELNRKHEVARKKAMDLGVQYGILSKEFLDASNIANQYDSKLKQVDSTLGKHNRNVGNYNNLQIQLGQVLREAPNFAIDPRIGIMSLTNNIPMLAEAIGDVSTKAKVMKEEFKLAAIAAKELAIADAIATGATKENAAALGLQAEAQIAANYQNSKAPSLLKQIAGSLFSWQTLIIVGISLLTLYSKEVIEWTRSIFGSAEAIDKTKESQKGLAEALKNTDFKKAIRDVSEMTNIFSLAREGVISKEKALKFYNETLGRVMGSAKDLNEAEQILIKNADNYIKATLYKAAANLALDKSAGEMLKAEEARQKKLVDFDNKFNDATITQIRSKEQFDAEERRIANARKKRQQEEIKAAEDNARVQENIAKNMMKTAAVFSKGMNFDSLIGKDSPKPKANKSSTSSLSKEQVDYLASLAAIRDNEIANQRERQLNGKINEKQYWEEYIKIITNYKTKIEAYLTGANGRQRAIEASVRRRGIEEIVKVNKEIYDINFKENESNHKLKIQELEKQSNEIAKNDYLSNSDRLTKQIEIDDKLISETSEYWKTQIELAKLANQETLSLETKRDEEINKLQDDRLKNTSSIFDNFKKDIEAQNKYLKTLNGITFEEQKQKILSDKKLDNKQKEYLLDILSLENQKEQNRLEIEGLQKQNAELEKKAGNLPSGTLLTPEELQLQADNLEKIAQLGSQNIEIDISLKEKLSPQLEALKNIFTDGFRSLGLDSFADKFDKLFDKIKAKTADWKDYTAAAFALIGDIGSQYVEARKEQEIAALDEQLKHTQETTEQELEFINGRLDRLNAIEDLTQEQIEERNALEDEARTLREQQLQREKQIETQKARAQQRAAAQMALINGALAASTTLATLGIPLGIVPAGIALGFGAIQAAFIMSKDPTPQYFVGRDGGKAEWAWTQEKGAELHTDKKGNIKSYGSDGGAKMTWLDEGDKIYTASQTKDILNGLNDGNNIGWGGIAKKGMTMPIIINQTSDNSEKIISGVGKEFDKVFKKYDKTVYFEDENGYLYSQNGGQYPINRGKKRVQPQSVQIKLRNNGRD